MSSNLGINSFVLKRLFATLKLSGGEDIFTCENNFYVQDGTFRHKNYFPMNSATLSVFLR